jgi:hypothetical protein
MEIQEAALKMLRQGKSVLEVEQELLRVMNELKSMKVYIQALQDADFAP